MKPDDESAEINAANAENEPIDDAPECARPCDPIVDCEACAEYWRRMRFEGYWVDGKGWTDAGFREILK